MNYKVIVSMIVLMIGLCFPIAQSEAAELNFSVQAVIPDNQIDKKQTYFDLKMEPKQEQNLAVIMTNTTDKSILVEVSANTAITNDNGIVEYNNTTKKADDSLKVGFKDLAKVEPEIIIPANQSVQAIVHLKMPDEPFKGVILGGLVFSEKLTKDQIEAEKGNQITNLFAYTIGVELTESNEAVSPNLKLIGVTAGQVNFRNAILATIQNDQPTIIKDLKIIGNIYKKNEKGILYKTELTDCRMAPNSNFNLAVSLDNQEMKPGDYTFKGIATSGEKKWEFSKEFSIDAAVAKKNNKKAVELEKTNKWMNVGIVAIILCLTVVIGVLIYKLKKLKARDKKRGKKRSKKRSKKNKKD